MVTKISGIPRGEALTVDLAELGGAQLARWAVREKAPVVITDCLLVKLGFRLEEVQVFLGERSTGRLGTHGGGAGQTDRTGCKN